jgi:Rps23 Pro-64 3,4-dihydroxylase Tpa1-like proline 4-hydroxylase
VSFFFDPETLAPCAQRYGEQYRSATPFPHVVIEDFLPIDALERILAQFPSPAAAEGDPAWRHYQRSQERDKYQLSDERRIPPFIRQVLFAFNSAVFLSFLEQLTGIRGLVADPSLWGGGLHQTTRGGKLGVHADFNRHPDLDLDRRLNVLLFLNPGWQEQWGGALELWARDMSHCAVRIPPVLNRCVIFNTTDWSFHGHPDPLDCPPDVSRRSLALYYYSNGRPENEIVPRHNDTLFRRRPGRRELDNRLQLRTLYWGRKLAPSALLRLRVAILRRMGRLP